MSCSTKATRLLNSLLYATVPKAILGSLNQEHFQAFSNFRSILWKSSQNLVFSGFSFFTECFEKHSNQYNYMNLVSGLCMGM